MYSTVESTKFSQRSARELLLHRNIQVSINLHGKSYACLMCVVCIVRMCVMLYIELMVSKLKPSLVYRGYIDHLFFLRKHLLESFARISFRSS